MEELAEFFTALGDATRLRILSVINKQELCVCEIVNSLNMSQPKVSRHLKILKNAGVVEDRREAQMVFYSVNTHSNLWDYTGDALEKVLDEKILPDDAERLENCLAKRVEGRCCPEVSR